MSNFFKNTKWNTTYNEAIRILEIPHSEKDLNLIKNAWLNQFEKFGFKSLMEKQLDLVVKEQKYRKELSDCVDFIDKMDILHNSGDFNTHSIEEVAQIIKENQEKAFSQLEKIKEDNTSLSKEYDSLIAEWKSIETVYKRALQCYTSSFYHPESDLLAIKLTHKDKMFEEPEQIEMCFELAKRQRKQLGCAKRSLPSNKYALHKLTNVILNNEQVLNSAINKREKRNRHQQKTA